MTTLLLWPSGELRQRADLDPVDMLRDAGVEGQIVAITLEGEGHNFVVHMCIDPTQPINPFARHAIDMLSGLHLMCFGPVLITGLDDDTITEISRG